MAHFKIQQGVDLALQNGHSLQQLLYRHGSHGALSSNTDQDAGRVRVSDGFTPTCRLSAGASVQRCTSRSNFDLVCCVFQRQRDTSSAGEAAFCCSLLQPYHALPQQTHHPTHNWDSRGTQMCTVRKDAP